MAPLIFVCIKRNFWSGKIRFKIKKKVQRSDQKPFEKFCIYIITLLMFLQSEI